MNRPRLTSWPGAALGFFFYYYLTGGSVGSRVWHHWKCKSNITRLNGPCALTDKLKSKLETMTIKTCCAKYTAAINSSESAVFLPDKKTKWCVWVNLPPESHSILWISENLLHKVKQHSWLSSLMYLFVVGDSLCFTVILTHGMCVNVTQIIWRRIQTWNGVVTTMEGIIWMREKWRVWMSWN